MATPFPRTLRSLPNEGLVRDAVLAVFGGLMMSGWLGWAALSRMAVYVATPQARIEVDRMTHPVDSPVSGRIVKLDMTLGRKVEAGDVLAELEVKPQEL